MSARPSMGDGGQVHRLYLAVIISVTRLTLAMLQVSCAHVLQRWAERWGRGLGVGIGGIDAGSAVAAEDAAISRPTRTTPMSWSRWTGTGRGWAGRSR